MTEAPRGWGASGLSLETSSPLEHPLCLNLSGVGLALLLASVAPPSFSHGLGGLPLDCPSESQGT